MERKTDNSKLMKKIIQIAGDFLLWILLRVKSILFLPFLIYYVIKIKKKEKELMLMFVEAEEVIKKLEVSKCNCGRKLKSKGKGFMNFKTCVCKKIDFMKPFNYNGY